MLLLTVIILTILVTMSYIIFNKDILSPSVIVPLGVLFSSVCALYNEKKWALDFSGYTVFFITTGLLAFILGGIIAVYMVNIFKSKTLYFDHPYCEIEPIIINKYKSLCVILFQIIVMVFLYRQIQQTVGGSGWIEIVSEFRRGTGFAADLFDDTFKLPFLLKQSIDISFYIGLVYAYIIGNNIVAKEKGNLINWIPVVLATTTGFLQGYRSDMLRFWIAILVVSYTLKMRENGWHTSKNTKRMIKNIVLSFFCIALLFILLKEFVGRSDDMDGFYYLAFYAGSPVAALDLFLKDGMPSSNIWGKETFFALNRNFAIWLNMPELLYVFYKEFRMSPNGIVIGNVYTALRPPYQDFGYIGMLLFMFCMGNFYTYFYYKVRHKNGRSKIDFKLLIYSYISYTFFLYFYNLYNNFISIAMIKNILLLYFLRWWLLDCKFKLNFRHII